MFIVTTKADVIKPNNGIEPYQVVKIQLRSLKNNDDPFKEIYDNKGFAYDREYESGGDHIPLEFYLKTFPISKINNYYFRRILCCN